ncbi:MAG: hypothetical protein GX992_00340 [Clostridium sp.]|nr:hypothetical protein [Clostridium sp.]
MMKFIEINKDLIPYYFEIKLAGITWGFEVRYNREFDFFTIDLYRQEELIAAGEKVVYGQSLFSILMEDGRPGIDIIPFDQSGNSNRVGWDELGKSVFLYLVGGDDDE